MYILAIDRVSRNDALLPIGSQGNMNYWPNSEDDPPSPRGSTNKDIAISWSFPSVSKVSLELEQT